MPGNLGYRTNAYQNMSPGAGMPPVQGGMPMSMAPYSRAQMGGGMPQQQPQMMQPPPGMGMPQQGAQGGGQNPLMAMLQQNPQLLQRLQSMVQGAGMGQGGPQNIVPGGGAGGLLSGIF